MNAFGGPSKGSPTWINFTKVACLDGLSKQKTDTFVYVGAAVIPTPSPRDSVSFTPHRPRSGRDKAA